MTQNHNHYRYCFNCDKWKKKSEINEVDLGEQPGGGSKCYYCNTCRKDLGDTIQIFRCHKHNDEILKVWGVLDGENQEKIFYDKCPQEQQEKEQEPSFWEKIPMPAKIGGGIITFLLGLLVTAKLWLVKANKHVEKVEDKLKSVQDRMTKKTEKKNEKSKEEEIKEVIKPDEIENDSAE